MKKAINQTRLIIGLLLIIIIIAGCTARPTNYVGKVNDRFITTQEYNLAYRNQYESYYLEYGFSPDESEKQQMSDAAFNNVVEGIVFQEQLRRYEITVTTQEVIDLLTKEVPDIILTSRQFNIEGEFDLNKYVQSLRTNKPVDLAWLVELYYQIYAPLGKLKERVQAEMPIKEEEIFDEYLVENSSANASLIAFYYDSFEDTVVYDREVESYYQKNRLDYLLDPYVSFQYIVFPLEANKADILNTKTVADSVYQELQDGILFSILAGKVSDAPTATKNGEMNFIELSSLPNNIRQDIEKLELDQYTKPYEIAEGWALYQLMARTRSLVKLREIVIKHKPSPHTKNRLYEQAVNIRSLASEVGLKRAAREFDIEVSQVNKVTPENPYIPGLGKSDSVVEKGIAAVKGTIFEPMFNNYLQAYVLLYVIDNQKRDFKPLHQVADKIREELVLQKRKDAAHKKVEEFLKKSNYGNVLAMAENSGREVFDFERFDSTTYFPQADIKELTTMMFTPKKDRIVCKEVEGKDGLYVGVVHTFYPANRMEFTNEVKNSIRGKIFERTKEDYFTEWQKAERKKVKVKDWRKSVK
ncbi:MAG: peptidylprolyl isomerase [Candidatus Cloacimonas sp.]|nr:SurA N-terminal domain-containing protein [Candidatus Cloacimonadota bacterium]